MRLAVLYLTLVALPTLGVWGILRVGETLTPPTSVSGVWRLEANPSDATDATCGYLLRPAAQASLTISQSGPHLLLTLNNQDSTTLVGRIDGEEITAEAAAASSRAVGGGSEAASASTHLEARVDRQAEATRLQGSLTTTQCSLRTVVPFVAVRQSDPGQ
jgi:hypothetical protein